MLGQQGRLKTRPKPNNKPPQVRVDLRLSYIQSPENPDVFLLEPGKF